MPGRRFIRKRVDEPGPPKLRIPLPLQRKPSDFLRGFAEAAASLTKKQPKKRYSAIICVGSTMRYERLGCAREKVLEARFPTTPISMRTLVLRGASIRD